LWGDGTGYALTVKKHYASEAQKLKDKIKAASGQKVKNRKKRLFIYAFNLLDLDTNMYLATGTSFRSENEAFQAALAMAEDLDIDVESLRLDRYYSTQGRVKLIEEKLGKLTLYLIPKKNVTVKGSWGWKRMLARFVENVLAYLEEYFQRNKSESGFGQDKKRTGWQLGQKREDRLDTANFLTMVWHNLYNLG
jgi:transposase